MTKTLLICLALMGAACTSVDQHDGGGPKARIDGGDRSDAGVAPLADAGPWDASNAGACEIVYGESADFGIMVNQVPPFSERGSDDYDGPVTVAEIEGEEDGGMAVGLDLAATTGLHATFYGATPSLRNGATLWASLHQTHWYPDLDNHLDSYDNSVRVSENGPILAEHQVTDRSTSTDARPFLGVSATFAQFCEEAIGCGSRKFFSVTVHGDTDLTLTEGSRGRVAIAHTDYSVWLDSATITTYYAPCARVPYVSGNLNLDIHGRAVRYEDVLPPAE